MLIVHHSCNKFQNKKKREQIFTYLLTVRSETYKISKSFYVFFVCQEFKFHFAILPECRGSRIYTVLFRPVFVCYGSIQARISLSRLYCDVFLWILFFSLLPSICKNVQYFIHEYLTQIGKSRISERRFALVTILLLVFLERQKINAMQEFELMYN